MRISVFRWEMRFHRPRRLGFRYSGVRRGLSSRLTFSSDGCYGNLRAVSLRLGRERGCLRTGRDGKPELPPGKERLYRSNALDACSSSAELLSTFSPALRDKSFINGMNRIIMAVEDACGIARGTFSDPSEIARTATEVRSMRQRTCWTVCDIQRSLGNALERLAARLRQSCGALRAG